jgi:hypothetical protein
LLFVVGLAVLGYVGWTYRDRLPLPGGAGDPSPTVGTVPAETPTTPAPKGVLARIRESGVVRVGMEPDAAATMASRRRMVSTSDTARLIAENLGASVVVEFVHEELPGALLEASDLIMAGMSPIRPSPVSCGPTVISISVCA